MCQRMTGSCDTNLWLNGRKIKDICFIVTVQYGGNCMNYRTVFKRAQIFMACRLGVEMGWACGAYG